MLTEKSLRGGHDFSTDLLFPLNFQIESVIIFVLNLIVLLDGRNVSLENILQFFSGASKLPATGLDGNPIISFTSQDCLPYVSTCGLCIFFPRSIGCLSYDDFQDKMDLCILGSFGFGTV